MTRYHFTSYLYICLSYCTTGHYDEQGIDTGGLRDTALLEVYNKQSVDTDGLLIGLMWHGILQITIGGLEHGLTPLAEACPALHVMEKPTEFLGALWLPYRRQRAELEAALQAAGTAKAIFAHADVVSIALHQSMHGALGQQ